MQATFTLSISTVLNLYTDVVIDPTVAQIMSVVVHAQYELQPACLQTSRNVGRYMEIQSKNLVQSVLQVRPLSSQLLLD